MHIIKPANRTKLANPGCSLAQLFIAIILLCIPSLACFSYFAARPVTARSVNNHDDKIVQIAHIPAISTTSLTTRFKHPPKDNGLDDRYYVGTTITLTKSGRVYGLGNNINGGVGTGVDCQKEQTDTPLKTVEVDMEPPCYYRQFQDITKYFGGEKVIKLASSTGGIITAVTESGKLYWWGGRKHYNDQPWQVQTKPIQEARLSSHAIIGYSGSETGNPTSSDSWFAFSKDTIFKLSSYRDIWIDDDGITEIKPQLDGATIREVGYVYGDGMDKDSPINFRQGYYALTSRHELLLVKSDGSTTKIASDKLKDRGGIKHIYRDYAIDMEGKPWYYGHVGTYDHPLWNNTELLHDMTPEATSNVPKLDKFIGPGNYGDIDRLVFGVDGHVYALRYQNISEEGITVRYELLISDETAQTSQQLPYLFSGTIRSNKSEWKTHEPLYDYAYTTDDNPQAVCGAISGNAYYVWNPGDDLNGDRPPVNIIKPVNGVFEPTCAEIPSNDPDPVKPPTPPQPSTPGMPRLPGAPNTGLKDDKVVQLVHSPATSVYYGEQKHGNMELWRDQDYAGTTVVLTESGKLYAWGNNIAGGVGNDTGYASTLNKKPPVYYSGPQDITRFFNGDKVVKLVNHLHTFAAITSSGKVYYWGHRLSDKDKKAIMHPVTLSELSPYHIIGFGRNIGFGNGLSYVASHQDNSSDYLAFSKDTIFTLNYNLNTSQLQYHDEAKNRIKPRLGSTTILDVDYIKHRTPTANEPEPDKGGYYTLTSDHKLLRVLEDGTVSEITNSEIKKRGGFKQLSYAGHYAIDRQGGLWYYGYREGNDSIHDMAKISTSGKLPRLDNFFSTLGPVARGTDGAIYAITDTHISSHDQYFVGRSVDPVNVSTLLSKQKIKFLSGEVETRYRGDSGYAPYPKDLPLYDFAFVPQSEPDTVCVGQSGTAYNRIYGENRGPRFETIQPVDGTIPSTCVKLPPWDDGKPNPSPTPGAPDTPRLPGVPNTGGESYIPIQMLTLG